MENGGVFVKKSGKWGCFVKSGPFLNAGGIMYSISIFLFYTLLIGGCVYAPNAQRRSQAGVLGVPGTPNPIPLKLLRIKRVRTRHALRIRLIEL